MKKKEFILKYKNSFFGKGRIRTYVEIFQQIYSLSLLTTQPLSQQLYEVSKRILYLYKIQYSSRNQIAQCIITVSCNKKIKFFIFVKKLNILEQFQQNV
jgi:hypothetical protein